MGSIPVGVTKKEESTSCSLFLCLPQGNRIKEKIAESNLCFSTKQSSGLFVGYGRTGEIPVGVYGLKLTHRTRTLRYRGLTPVRHMTGKL